MPNFRLIPDGEGELIRSVFGVGKVRGPDAFAAGGVVTLPAGYVVAAPTGDDTGLLFQLTQPVFVAASDGDEVFATVVRGELVSIDAAPATPEGSFRLGTAEGVPVDTFNQDARAGGVQFAPAFVAQTVSVDFNGVAEELRSDNSENIGIADEWSIGIWYKPGAEITTGSRQLMQINPGAGRNNINLFGQATDRRLQLVLTGGGGLPSRILLWHNIFTAGEAGNWHHLLLTWDGADPTLYKDGSSLAPDSDDMAALALPFTDEPRYIGVGTQWDGSGASWLGLMHQISIWRTDLGSIISDLYNGGAPAALNLNGSFGSYTASGDLAHWWRLGHDSSDVGKDYSEAGFTPLISLGTNAVNMDGDDVVSDIPT